MATVPPQESSQTAAPMTRRERAFLGDLPEDFLSIETPSTARAYPQPVAQPTGYREQHLVPMTYAPQAQHHHYRPVDNSLGKLKVTICQAKLTKNYGFTRMDPYCRIRIGHAVYETPTDTNGSKNPRWNKTFACNISRGVNNCYIEVFDERYLALDDRVAWAYYEFTQELFNGETLEEWIPLSGKQGQEQEGNINLIFSFTPAPTPQSFQLTAYGNQPVSVVPPTMPGAQVYYQGGYPATYPPTQGYPPQQQPYMGQQQPQGVQAPPSRPRVREEDIQQLQEMFPSLEKDVIHSVLEASNGQVDAAVTNLLQMT